MWEDVAIATVIIHTREKGSKSSNPWSHIVAYRPRFIYKALSIKSFKIQQLPLLSRGLGLTKETHSYNTLHRMVPPQIPFSKYVK